MSHGPIQRVLFYLVRFLKKTSYHHKKKLITLAVIALLSYVAKKKLRLIHLIQLASKITAIIEYLPLPTFPQYRKLNRYQPVSLKPLLREIMAVMDVDSIKERVRAKQTDWRELKQSILTGTILSLVLYNIQSFYFIVQNKYQPDFVQLNCVQQFQQLMGEMRRKFTQQIPSVYQTLLNLLSTNIQSIDVNGEYSLDEYYHLIEQMVGRVFEKRFVVECRQSERVQNSFYKHDKAFDVAANYFLMPYEYQPKSSSKLAIITNKITSIFSIFNLFKLFPQPVCEVTSERFSWAEVAYRIPLKKGLSVDLQWPNRQGELLSKLVLTEMDQMLSSVNFATVLYEHAQYHLQLLKNRMFLYFSKNNITHMKTTKILPIIYKLIREQILINNVNKNIIDENDDKRQRFYESQIMKAIRYKKVAEQQRKIKDGEQQQHALLIREQREQVLKQVESSGVNQQQQDEGVQKPEVILLNIHLEQIYQARTFSHLVREFQLKYFNERSGVVLNPIQKQGEKVSRPGTEQDEFKKLLNMLGDNQELNKKQ